MLPTPQARDGNNRGAAEPARRRAMGHQVSLHDAVNSTVNPVPTPTAINPNDSEDSAHWLSRRDRQQMRGIDGRGMDRPLPIAVRSLPTPTASDAKNGTRRTHAGGSSLADQAKLLPTPRASDTGTPGRRAGTGFRPPLSQQVLPLVNPKTFLPTPRASDGTKGSPAQRGSKGDLMLPSAVINLLTADARHDL